MAFVLKHKRRRFFAFLTSTFRNGKSLLVGSGRDGFRLMYKARVIRVASPKAAGAALGESARG